MTKEQRAELRKAAEEATPGPWITVSAGDVPSLVVATEDRVSLLTVVDEEAHDGEVIKFGALYEAQDAEYIAAANPATILQLLDYVESLEKQRDDLLAVAEHIQRCIPYGGFCQIHHGSATAADLDAAIASVKEK